MLEHELQETPAVQIPAAQRRVSAEELTRAVSALEDAKAAERVAGVAPIGQVVEELGLDSTPEEIWAEIVKQRTQKAAEAVPVPQAQTVPVMQPKIGRQARRGWRGMRGWIWIVFWCTGGFGLLTGLPHLLSQTVAITGDSTAETIPAQGKNILILGDGDKITLLGHAHSVIILGDKTTLRGEAPKTYESLGDHNDVQWNSKP
jgi:hypothetical protein